MMIYFYIILKASIEIDNLVFDYDFEGKISAIEFLNAVEFFEDVNFEDKNITKEMLSDIKESKLEILEKNNFLMIKCFILFNSNKSIKTPIMIPNIKETSPTLAEILFLLT